MTVTEQDLALWVERFALDPTVPSGIRWKKLLSYQNRQHMAGHLVEGYYRVKTRGKTYACHRIVLALNGVMPACGETEVDHIDGNPANNALSNLRWCTRRVNEQNKRNRGRSGLRYVRPTPEGRWYASYQCFKVGKKKYVGTYDTPYEAHIAALVHRLEHNWNP